MGEGLNFQFELPDEEKWSGLRSELKLSDEEYDALKVTIQEAAVVSDELRRVGQKAQVKAGLTILDRLLGNLERGLERVDVTGAVKAISSSGELGILISATAVREIDKYREVGLNIADVERVLDRKKFRGEQIKPSELDALSLSDRRHQLDHLTHEGMLFAVRHLRQPVKAWIDRASQDKGGNSPKSDREALIFLLARDAVKIFGPGVEMSVPGPFVGLCAVIFHACGIDESGIEDAIRRCLKKYKGWLTWSRSLALEAKEYETDTEQVGGVNDDKPEL